MRLQPKDQDSFDVPVRWLMPIAVAIGVGATAVAAWLAGSGIVPFELHVRSPVLQPYAPLTVELARCNELGQAALDETACMAAWAQNRRRFLSAPDEPASDRTGPRVIPLHEGQR
ncbi:MAG TPA: putative entry exclusion protein TrbK-alt [Mesorhizobium sp.]|jgi:conjugative transfer region protein TrbK|nr:putative entry exclusion protein TrbK-alt [Mesorhizobium sp.]